MMKSKKVFLRCLCTISTSLFFIVCGSVWIFIWPLVVDYILTLRPNSDIYNLWQKIPMDVPTHFYLFNWTNPQDIYNKSIKPKFEEIGPYKFVQTEEKCNITWNNNGTVTYQKLRYWYRDTTQDNGNLEDDVTFINPVAMIAANRARSWNYVSRKGLSLALSNLAPTIQITRKVREVLFDGYPDRLIKMANAMPFWGKDAIPDWDKFGWFYMRNGSYDFDGVYNMGTGKNSTFGRLYSWNHNTQNPFLKGACLKMQRSAGEFFGRNIGESVAFFSPDMRRTAIFKLVGEKKVRNIVGNYYVVEDLMLDNGTKYPENECYCNGECVPSGVLNTSSAIYGSPLFGSLPHFHRADPYYVNSLEGLHPDINQHEVSITIEPKTGIPLEVSGKIQANFLMQPVPDVTLYQDAPKIFMPLFWIKQHAQIPYKEAFKLKLILSIPTTCITVGSLMIMIGLIILLLIVCTKYREQCANGKNKISYPEEDVPLNIQHKANIKKSTTSIPSQ